MNFKLTLLSVLIPLLSFGQTRRITGKIIDDHFETLPFVGIYTTGHMLLGKASINGEFTLDIPEKTETLLFAAVSYEHTLIKIINKCEYIEVVMIEAANFHYISNAKIDRIRKREFNKLLSVHTKAFQKGVFLSSSPCYKQEFEPQKKSLDSIGRLIKLNDKQVKAYFKKLKAGDSIRIPHHPDYGYLTGDRSDYNCIIRGIVIRKDRKKHGYNLTYRVSGFELCKDEDFKEKRNKIIEGQVLRYNIRYDKIIF